MGPPRHRRQLRWGHAVCLRRPGWRRQRRTHHRRARRPDKTDKFDRAPRRAHLQGDAIGNGAKWQRQIIDNGGVAVEDLAVADLNGDGKTGHRRRGPGRPRTFASTGTRRNDRSSLHLVPKLCLGTIRKLRPCAEMERQLPACEVPERSLTNSGDRHLMVTGKSNLVFPLLTSSPPPCSSSRSRCPLARP